MRLVTFQETIGEYEGDQSLIDSAMDTVYNIKEKEPHSDGNSNYGGWQKRFEHPIQTVIEYQFREYLQDSGIPQPKWVVFTNFFCNINPPGAFHIMHHHTIGEFSGAFWLQADDNAGDLVVMNPFYNRFLNTCMFPAKDKDYNAAYFIPKPNTGVFFNSNLVHYVDVNRSNRDRVSIGYHIGVHY